MDNIVNKTVLVIGGWGLVGNAVTRKLIQEKPKRIIVTSLRKEEALEQVAALRKEFPKEAENFFVPWWGNILVREEFKDMDRNEILRDPEMRKILMHDTLDELNDEIKNHSALYKLINDTKPDIIIDCINTATGIAYQDIYTAYNRVKHIMNTEPTVETMKEEMERLLCIDYIPQLIRHIQILFSAMSKAETQLYFKVGTSGTGGMGLNIPYTHSEEKPSRVLLSKSAVAGAHTLLLFLMARTPGATITKEIKPAAAIAWKKIECGNVIRKGKPIDLLDIPMDASITLGDQFKFALDIPFGKNGQQLKSVFIDTGENGVFSRGEFEAISAHQQMEFVTPEEIADKILFEIKGGNTGHDVINALDIASLNPSYRAGYLQHFAVEKLAELEDINDIKSVAFEMLGPPKLSKLLYELHLMTKVAGTMKQISEAKHDDLSTGIVKLIEGDSRLRSEMLSIGLGILMPDGKSFLRGNELKIPVKTDNDIIPLTPEKIEQWAEEGWVDLREKNMNTWQQRLKQLMQEAEAIPENDTSSLHVRTKRYWNNFKEVSLGRVISWIFITEEHGGRIKD